MPSTSRRGVDNALPNASLPVCSSNTARSVNVPPISAARRRLDLFRGDVRRGMIEGQSAYYGGRARSTAAHDHEKSGRSLLLRFSTWIADRIARQAPSDIAPRQFRKINQ